MSDLIKASSFSVSDIRDKSNDFETIHDVRLAKNPPLWTQKTSKNKQPSKKHNVTSSNTDHRVGELAGKMARKKTKNDSESPTVRGLKTVRNVLMWLTATIALNFALALIAKFVLPFVLPHSIK